MYPYKIIQYDISIDINTDKLEYSGKTLINLEILQDIPVIKINSSGIEIISIKINGIKINKWDENKNKEYLKIKYNFKKSFKYKIEFEIKNIIRDEIDGLYYWKQNGNLILCTHFEPKSARKFIPCFDEPDLKSIFVLEVSIDSKLNVLSNTSINQIVFLNSNKKKISFKPTPLMSTYLLAMVAGNIINPSNTSYYLNNIKINGYCLENKVNQIKWAIGKTKEALEYFIELFGINYPLDKLDIVAIPNFSSGAMENWGLITFREEYVLLYDKEDYLSQIKILEVIYHEIAHQWFGNLVTMDNWNNLWLNESTATYFSWMGLAKLYPEYLVKEMYWLSEYKYVLVSDAMTNTHPIDMTNDNILSEPHELFDEITYSKGNNIIRYISNLMGIDNFQKAINKYLNSNLYSNSTSTQLYNYFNEFSSNKHIDYIGLMSQLVKTKGYPILTIGKDADTNDYFIKYTKFNLDKTKKSDYPYSLWVKIKYWDSYNLSETIIELIPGIKNYLPFEITDSNIFIANPDNIMFCICEYSNCIPPLNNMSQVELMKYVHDEFILGLYNWGNNDLFQYLNKISQVIKTVDLNKNYLLMYQIVMDLIKIIQIIKLSNIPNNQINNFIKNTRIKWLKVLEFLNNNRPRYYQMVLDKILELETIWINGLNSFNDFDIFLEYFNQIIKIKTWDELTSIFNKTLYMLIIKYYQKEKLGKILDILSHTTNPNIISNIIESFSMLDDASFVLVFSNYIPMIKSQDYGLFFGSISKIITKQEFIIDYWIQFKQNISTFQETQLKILKKISSNIYDTKLIDKILNHMNQNPKYKEYEIIFYKIIDILETNKIITNQLEKLQRPNIN